MLFGGAGALSSVVAHGLCWTKTRFDEPAWRMAAFEKSEPIVRIRCGVREVVAAAQRVAARERASIFLGVVNYTPEDDLVRHAKRVAAGAYKPVASTAANALLMKRKAFRFEREVRLLWLDRGATVLSERQISIDSRRDITQVMVSPHVKEIEYRRLAQEWATLGVGVPFVRSGILRVPSLGRSETA